MAIKVGDQVIVLPNAVEVHVSPSIVGEIVEVLTVDKDCLWFDFHGCPWWCCINMVEPVTGPW